MDDIDKFINNFADNYDGGGYCVYNEWFDDNSGTGYGIDYDLGRGRGASNGCWDSKGFGEGFRFGGHISAISNDVVGRCYVNTDNLYGKHR